MFGDAAALPSPLGQAFATVNNFKRLPVQDRLSIAGLLYAILDLNRSDAVFRQYDGGSGVIAARDMGMALYDLGIPSDAKAQALDVISRLGTQQFTLGEFRSFIKTVKAGKVGVLVSGGA